MVHREQSTAKRQQNQTKELIVLIELIELTYLGHHE